MNLLIDALAVWRISYLLVKEDGPNLLIRRIREWSGIEYDQDGNEVSWNESTPLRCIYCTSIYVAGIILVMPNWIRRLFALSGAAILVNVWHDQTQRQN